jgi:hypothetical protein
MTTSRPLRPAAIVGALGVLLCGCGALDDLLDVDVPDRVIDETLTDPTQARLLVGGVVAEFECAFGSSTIALGLLGDELAVATLNAGIWAIDRRSVQPQEGILGIYATSDCVGFGQNGVGIYTPLASARWYADWVSGLLDGWTDSQVADRRRLRATTLTYGGYSLVLLGESFCATALDGGAPMTQAQTLALAEERLTQALAEAQAANDADLANFARIGRARARIDQGKKAEAAADAGAVPIGYLKVAAAEAGRPERENRVFVNNNREALVSIDAPFRGLTFGGVPDPRVVVVDAGRTGQDGTTSLWVQRKYLSEAAGIPIASGHEARLIVAEAALPADPGAATAIINELHDAAGLPHYGGGTAAEVLAQLIEERRRELFLDTHRVFDLARFQLPFPGPTGAPFPKGGVYGNQTCFPLPDRERQPAASQ